MDRTRSRPAPQARGRTLHVLDVENLVGGTTAGTASVEACLSAYRSTIAVAPVDHAVLGSGTTFACACAEAWPGARLHLGRGLDGADHALLQAIDPDFTARRYDRVVVGSGDHIFCGLVTGLRSRGLAVLVVARPGSLSRDLRRLAPYRPLRDAAAAVAA